MSNDWHTAGNWSNNQVPGATDNVTIPPPAFYKYAPEVNANAQVNKIYLYGIGTITIKQGAYLDIGD